MPYQIDFDDQCSIVVIRVTRALIPLDYLAVNETIGERGKANRLLILIDFNGFQEAITDIREWVLFVDRIKQTQTPRVALLSTYVGHSTSCHLIALWVNRSDDNVQAFQDMENARNWLQKGT